MIRVAGEVQEESIRKPRASGADPPQRRVYAQDPRVNPARAGMIRRTDVFTARMESKPRASGDDPLIAAADGTLAG